jgi:hypothetical protein
MNPPLWVRGVASLAVGLSLAACGGSSAHVQPLQAQFKHVAADSAEGAGAPHISSSKSRRSSSTAPRLGVYIGPANDGRSKCGYVSAGAGVQQASAFSVAGVSCRTARALAAAAAGHELGSRVYVAQSFRCTGTRPSSRAVLLYRCTNGRRSVRFVVS